LFNGLTEVRCSSLYCTRTTAMLSAVSSIISNKGKVKKSVHKEGDLQNRTFVIGLPVCETLSIRRSQRKMLVATAIFAGNREVTADRGELTLYNKPPV
jgi:hypothetical protein